MAKALPMLLPTEAPEHAVSSPSPRSPIKSRRLSPAMITAATGEETLENLEEVEIIFGGVSEIGGLERCTRLRTLTLIDCGLRRISNLEPVSHSLVKLCLCDQGLKKMENLFLPGLKELYLHQNKIAKIDGLQGCPSLRRLWLFSNRIAVAEGLHHCGALRELWLHDNKITKATGLESLVHLQNLGLAGNPIAGLRHLAGLRGLPSLVELTLDDVHFGTCPVVRSEGYRDFVMCFLRQVQRLDGLEVAEADREEAAVKYEVEALRYQEKLEEIERKRIHEIRQAEMARDEGENYGSEIKAEMMRAFQGLEELVKEGRAAMAEERSRQEEIQASNLRELEASLADLQKQYCREVDKRVRAEEAKADEEERLFAALEKRTCLERDYSQLLARQQGGLHQEGIAVQELSHHSPDFQKLRREVWANQKTGSGRQVEWMNVLRACRLYNRRLCEDFLASAGESSPTIRLYLCLSGSEAEEVCRVGLSSLARAAVVLWPDPKQATTQAQARTGTPPTGRGPAAAAAATTEAATRTTQARSTKKSVSADPMDAADNAGTFGGRGDGTVIMQLAVVLLEEEVDSVEIGGRTEGMSAAVVAGGATAGRRSRCRETDRVARGRDEEGLHLLLPRLVDRAGVSGRVLRVMMPLASPPQQELAPAPATPVERDDDGNGKSRSHCFVLPARCFVRALPEFHLLCASGSTGENRRALEDALAELSTDAGIGAAPGTDLLSQLELKMQAEVAAYLERMQQEVTVDEASKLRATDADIRRKAANLASVRGSVETERALQEALLREGPHA